MGFVLSLKYLSLCVFDLREMAPVLSNDTDCSSCSKYFFRRPRLALAHGMLADRLMPIDLLVILYQPYNLPSTIPVPFSQLFDHFVLLRKGRILPIACVNHRRHL